MVKVIQSYFRKLRKYHYPKITTVHILVWECLNMLIFSTKFGLFDIYYFLLYHLTKVFLVSLKTVQRHGF